MERPSVHTIICNLHDHTGDELESQTVEIKGWCKNEKELSYAVAEAAVCLANTDGGFVFVGIENKKRGLAAVSPCPYAMVTPEWIEARIRDLTSPPVDCSVSRLSELMSAVSAPLSDVLVIDIGKTDRISGHRTRGVSYVRADKQCKPQYYAGDDDLSKSTLSRLTTDDLDANAVNLAAAHREITFPWLVALAGCGKRVFGPPSIEATAHYDTPY